MYPTIIKQFECEPIMFFAQQRKKIDFRMRLLSGDPSSVINY